MIDLTVSGMTCGGCAASVERMIKRVDPNAVVKIDLATGRVAAETAADAGALIAAIEKGGYGAKAAPN